MENLIVPDWAKVGGAASVLVELIKRGSRLLAKFFPGLEGLAGLADAYTAYLVWGLTGLFALWVSVPDPELSAIGIKVVEYVLSLALAFGIYAVGTAAAGLKTKTDDEVEA